MADVGNTIGQVLGTAFLICAVGGFVWGFIEFVTFLIRERKH